MQRRAMSSLPSGPATTGDGDWTSGAQRPRAARLGHLEKRLISCSSPRARRELRMSSARSRISCEQSCNRRCCKARSVPPGCQGECPEPARWRGILDCVIDFYSRTAPSRSLTTRRMRSTRDRAGALQRRATAYRRCVCTCARTISHTSLDASCCSLPAGQDGALL